MTAEDGAYGTVRVPTEMDCQYRRFEGAAGGVLNPTQGSIKVLTITGPARCTKEEAIKAAREVLR